jgi:hypothetical protein
MLLQIDECRRRVTDDIDELVKTLTSLTSRRTTSDESAWRSSLPKVAKAFSDPTTKSSTQEKAIMRRALP